MVSFVLIKFADELPSTNNGNRNRFYTGAQCNHIALIVHMDGFNSMNWIRLELGEAIRRFSFVGQNIGTVC